MGEGRGQGEARSEKEERKCGQDARKARNGGHGVSFARGEAEGGESDGKLG